MVLHLDNQIKAIPLHQLKQTKQLNNMALFKNFADVTAADLEFTNTVKAISDELKDSFYTWEEYPGIQSSELSEYLGQYGDLYEDANEDLHVVYPVDKRMATNLAKWLANYDMVYVEAGKCVVKRSNHTKAAQLLNKLIKLAA